MYCLCNVLAAQTGCALGQRSTNMLQAIPWVTSAAIIGSQLDWFWLRVVVVLLMPRGVLVLAARQPNDETAQHAAVCFVVALQCIATCAAAYVLVAASNFRLTHADVITTPLGNAHRSLSAIAATIASCLPVSETMFAICLREKC